jgi:hypothetical protein
MPSSRTRSWLLSFSLGLLLPVAGPASAQSLDEGWRHPPNEAKLRAYWWWLNGNVDRAAITRDLEEMADKGFGGAIITDAGGAEQRGNDNVPAGPAFASPQWRELFLHALREADRLGLELSLSIQSGWNLGGPTVVAEDSVKRVVWSEAVVSGPGPVRMALPRPETDPAYSRDRLVLAFPLEVPDGQDPARLVEWRAKALHDALRFPGPNGWFLTNSAPDTHSLIEHAPDEPGEPRVLTSQVVNLTDRLSSDGTLEWDAPPGQWRVLRFMATLAEHCRVSTHSAGGGGYAIDALDKGAFDRYWSAVVAPLLDAASPYVGRALRYLHTDSWEIDHFNWTPTFVEEFRARRGYDPVPFFPALTGRIVESRDVSTRFLNDYRKTLGDLAIDNHYRWLREYAHARGLGIHPESGGPHFTPIDAQRALGFNDIPMSEFWAASKEHRVLDIARFFVKQPASAAHTYGHRYVAAEGFTTIGPHWQATLWDNLKPSFDLASTEGLNRLVWHAFVCSPASMGIPGQQYFAGTHLNPLVTWWSRSRPFFDYINRSQWMLMQGHPVADVLYYYGDHVPNYTQLRASDPTGLGKGYDYDVITEEALLSRVAVEDGGLVLPDGTRYRLLALPPYETISLTALRKVAALVREGAVVVGPRPDRSDSLTGSPGVDTEVARLAGELWGATGPGRVLSGRSAREVLEERGAAPDFEAKGASPAADLHYIHRRSDDADIYFVANRSAEPETIDCTFRVRGRAPELWDAVSGTTRLATTYREAGGRTTVPIAFDPYGSVFVVFRTRAADHPPTGASNSPTYQARQRISGPWTVSFDPDWGGPAEAAFPDLVSWTDRPEEGIRHYSGTATYRTTVTLPDALAGRDLALDLGEVHELAELRVNGRRLGIVWSPPFRLDLGDAMQAGENTIEVDVVNFWANRVIGDAALPEAERRTRTNVRTLKADTPLMRSGLLGPVQLVEVVEPGPPAK